MKQYFTSLEASNEGYVATLFDSYTNQPVYKTKAHASQVEANMDIANYVKTQTTPSTLTAPADPNKPHPFPQTLKRKCCGG
jgi:hypothetical protein